MLSVDIIQRITGKFINDLDVGAAVYEPNLNVQNPFKDGTGANQANSVFTDTRTLAASTNEELDLSGGLTDAFGASILFTRIKAIIVTAAAANTNNVQVTRPASNGVPLFIAAGDGIELTPDASFTMVFPGANGITVTAATGDLIDFANSAGGSSVDYTIVIVGTV